MAEWMTLHEYTRLVDTFDHSVPSTAPPQVVQLDLAGGVLDDLVRAGPTEKDVYLCFGKNAVCKLDIH